MFSKKGLVGVDIGHYYTKVVYFENDKGVLKLKNVFKERTPDDVLTSEGCDEVVLGDFLKSIFSENRVKNKRVAFGLNSSFVITKTLSMPLVVDEEIEQAVMWEAEQYAPVEMEQVNVSYQVMEKNKEKNEMTILIAITKKEIVESFKSAFKRAKLKLDVVDVDIFSAANSFMFANKEKEKKHNLIVDLGYSSSKLIFLRNEHPMFTRYMDFNFSSVLTEAKDVFGVREDEIESILIKEDDEKKDNLLAFFNDKLFNLYSQIQNSITFYNSSILDVPEQIDNIVFTGVLGILYDNLNIENIREYLKAEVVQFNPFDFSSKEGVNNLEEIALGISSIYCVACGLSLRGL